MAVGTSGIHFDINSNNTLADKESTECNMDQEKMHMTLAKMMEEKHTFTYKKLVVPMSMRSIYWKYFGFPATDEGDILTRVKIVCILCKTQIAYNRNTSNLRMHLQNKHANEFLELEANTPRHRPSVDIKEKRAQKKLVKTSGALGGPPYIYSTAADGTVQIEGDVQFITDPNISLQNYDDFEESTSQNNVRVVLKGGSPGFNNQNVAIILPEENVDNSLHDMVDGKTVSDAIAEFIILDLQLPDVVEGRGFQRLIATLRSPCEIPSKTKLEEELIPNIYTSFKEALQCSVASISGEIGLSMEEWNTVNGEVYITVSIHYQHQSEPVLETKVLSTISCHPEIDASQWSIVLDDLFAEWQIKVENITAVVTAISRPEVLRALSNKNLTLVPCLIHSLQLSTSACFEQPAVAAILSKCRSIIELISRSSAAATALRINEHVMQLEENTLRKDYPRVWTTTYTMFEQLHIRKGIISSVLDNIDNIDKNSCNLDTEEWKILEDIVMVLEPLMVTIMMLSEEKTPLISLLKPLLWQLNSSHLKVKEADSETAKTFKESLAEKLSQRYSDTVANHLLHTATTLDPRFRQLSYTSEEEKNIVSSSIKEVLIKFIEEEGTVEESPNKKSRLSGMEFLLGHLCSAKSGIPAEERANLELVQYQSEITAALGCCPLQWWAKASAKHPNLMRLSRKYSCVPALTIPSHRIPQESQVLFDMRRSCLGPDLVDKMLFLNGNHTV